MTTPILTKTQQRKSLSAKKGPVKGLKNVLAQPYENYWPLLKNDLGATLEHLIKRLLPVLKRSETRIPWTQLRKMKKEERSSARRAAQIPCDVNYDESAAKSIVFGINAVTRLLEKDDISCILLDSNVDPSLLVKHIVVMARNKNVSILLISFLKKVTLDTIGFASAAIGLKKHVEDMSDNYFYTLFEKVSELSSELTISKAPVSLFQDKTIIDDVPNENQINIQQMEEDINDVQSCVVSTDIYLYRTSKKERVFKPSNVFKDKSEKTWTDFIALDDDKYVVDKVKVPLRFFESANPDKDNRNISGRDKALYKTTKKLVGESVKSTVNSKNKVSYKPLKVKRLKGNELRTKATKASKPPKVKKK